MRIPLTLRILLVRCLGSIPMVPIAHRKFLLCMLGLIPLVAPAQGTVRTITFDRLRLPPTWVIGQHSYYEEPMYFTPIQPDEQFAIAGGGRDGFPANGSNYIIQAYTDSLAGVRWGGGRFGLRSVDLAEFSVLYAYPADVDFVGYRADGDVVAVRFRTDGIMDSLGPLADFETFYFDERFSDLVRFEMPGYGFAMDNLVIFDVPEPGAGGLLLLAGGAFALRRRRS